MAVDYRLKDYFTYARLFHTTGATHFVVFLDNLAEDLSTPGGRAALRFVKAHNKEATSLDSC